MRFHERGFGISGLGFRSEGLEASQDGEDLLHWCWLGPARWRVDALQEQSCEGEENPGAWMIDWRVRGEVQLGFS